MYLLRSKRVGGEEELGSGSTVDVTRRRNKGRSMELHVRFAPPPALDMDSNLPPRRSITLSLPYSPLPIPLFHSHLLVYSSRTLQRRTTRIQMKRMMVLTPIALSDGEVESVFPFYRMGKRVVGEEREWVKNARDGEAAE